MTARARWIVLAAALVLSSAPALAEPVVVDRVAVRLVSPETGGSARPRFFTEREVAFFARLEAAVDRAEIGSAEYPERYVRAAVDRLAARTMLASLLIQRGTEPPDLPRLAADARAELADRLGGEDALRALMQKESLADAELDRLLRTQVRAAWYVDRVITPIHAVNEDQLREAHRSALHPYRGAKFEDVRGRLRRWVTVERLRAAELEFLQGARSRIKIVAVTGAG